MDLRKHSKDKDSFFMRGHLVSPTLAQERLWNLQQKCQRSLRKRWKTFEKDNGEWLNGDSVTFITYEINSIRKNHSDESKTNRL